MTKEEYYKKRSEILDKFPGWESKFHTYPLFRQCAEMLIRDVDPYIVIKELISVVETVSKAYEEHLNSCPRNIIKPTI